MYHYVISYSYWESCPPPCAHRMPSLVFLGIHPRSSPSSFLTFWQFIQRYSVWKTLIIWSVIYHLCSGFIAVNQLQWSIQFSSLLFKVFSIFPLSLYSLILTYSLHGFSVFREWDSWYSFSRGHKDGWCVIDCVGLVWAKMPGPIFLSQSSPADILSVPELSIPVDVSPVPKSAVPANV